MRLVLLYFEGEIDEEVYNKERKHFRETAEQHHKCPKSSVSAILPMRWILPDALDLANASHVSNWSEHHPQEALESPKDNDRNQEFLVIFSNNGVALLDFPVEVYAMDDEKQHENPIEHSKCAV